MTNTEYSDSVTIRRVDFHQLVRALVQIEDMAATARLGSRRKALDRICRVAYDAQTPVGKGVGFGSPEGLLSRVARRRSNLIVAAADPNDGIGDAP